MVGRRLIKKKKKSDSSVALDKLVQTAKGNISERDKGYREQSLKIHPWVCGRCGKEFSRENLQMLTVHHVDHNHDNNPSDGSNWENLCIYCHDREHQKLHDFEAYGDLGGRSSTIGDETAPTNNPFADLQQKMNNPK
jgi:5-methylcytosine-specific restriction endonuclease McrA